MLPTWLDLSPGKVALAVCVLGIVIAALIVAAYPIFNATIDEDLHIASGIEIYQHHRYTLLIEAPPLGRLGNLAFLPVLVFYVYRWSAPLWGNARGTSGSCWSWCFTSTAGPPSCRAVWPAWLL